MLAWAGAARAGRSRGAACCCRLPGEREAYGETDHTTDGTRKLFLRGGQGRWKTILSLSTPREGWSREEWFDLAADPGETRSAPPAAGAADAIRAARPGALAGRAADGAPARPVCLSPEQTERLRALGYVGGLADATCTPADVPLRR